MRIILEKEILDAYPETAIGYLIADVSVQKSDPFVEELKGRLEEHLKDLGLDATQFTLHPSIAVWRKIYEEDFHVKAKTYRSSLEALMRRVLTGKSIWNICSVVDLYNCCSVLSLLPMGGYDMAKITGDIRIRYAKEGESFLPLGERKPVQMRKEHVVYADDKQTLCWLWNHKDSADTCIDEETKRVLFFIDGFDRGQVQDAMQLLAENIQKIGGVCVERGILEATFSYTIS